MCYHGYLATYIAINLIQKTGRVDLDQFGKALRSDTSLASVMTVNNEIGVVQPVKEIGELCRKNKVGNNALLGYLNAS